jgi:hypothetical protein
MEIFESETLLAAEKGRQPITSNPSTKKKINQQKEFFILTTKVGRWQSNKRVV